MTRIELAPEVGEDIGRILDHPSASEPADGSKRLGEIIAALDILEQHPMIGRPVRGSLCELVIGRRSQGSIALYRYFPELDAVFVLAIRSQLDAGYSRG